MLSISPGVQINRNSPAFYLLKHFYEKEALADIVRARLPYLEDRQKAIELLSSLIYPPLETIKKNEINNLMHKMNYFLGDE